jgi:hypothetical protein
VDTPYVGILGNEKNGTFPKAQQLNILLTQSFIIKLPKMENVKCGGKILQTYGTVEISLEQPWTLQSIDLMLLESHD